MRKVNLTLTDSAANKLEEMFTPRKRGEGASEIIEEAYYHRVALPGVVKFLSEAAGVKAGEEGKR